MEKATQSIKHTPSDQNQCIFDHQLLPLLCMMEFQTRPHLSHYPTAIPSPLMCDTFQCAKRTVYSVVQQSRGAGLARHIKNVVVICEAVELGSAAPRVGTHFLEVQPVAHI